MAHHARGAVPGRLAGVPGQPRSHALIDGVAKVYSTNPAYAGLVEPIAGQTNVAQAIAAARQEAGHVATA